MRSQSQSPTSRRFVVYLTGVAIGFMLLGIFASRRSQEAAARDAARRAAEARSAAPQTPANPTPADQPADPAPPPAPAP